MLRSKAERPWARGHTESIALELAAHGHTVTAVLGDALYLVPGAHNGLLYNVTTTDPSTLASAFTSIIGVALVAGAIPAYRVTRVDPASVLRND